VRQLLPDPIDDVDPAVLYGADERPAPAERPWVVVNMIASVDGGTAVDGRSGPLGGPGDKAVFRALRSLADVVLVGAGTVRAEGYGPVRPHGEAAPARLAVVTASGDLDPGLRLFAEADPARPPLVLTCQACAAHRRAALDAVAEVVVVGDDQVDLRAALALLADRGARIVLAEGGPSVNGQLVADDLVDEWCLTLAPWLLGGGSPRSAEGSVPRGGPVALRLDRLLADEDGACFARYVRA
jgi:5-amino-6-(5-phosphoribosylamino)uracil reductase